MKESTFFKSVGFFGIFMMIGASHGPALAFIAGFLLTLVGFIIGYSIDD